MGRRHPNLWYFIKKLRQEEVRVITSVESARRGDAPPLRKRKYVVLQHRINRVQESYRAGRRNLDQYWAAMMYAVSTFN